MKRVVLDTNIIISSALGGALVFILEKWDEGKFTVIVTTDVVSEYFAVLNRPKFGLKQETLTGSSITSTSFPSLWFSKNKYGLLEMIPKMISSSKQQSQGRLISS